MIQFIKINFSIWDMELSAEELVLQCFISCIIHVSPKFASCTLHSVDFQWRVRVSTVTEALKLRFFQKNVCVCVFFFQENIPGGKKFVFKVI